MLVQVKFRMNLRMVYLLLVILDSSKKLVNLQENTNLAEHLKSILSVQRILDRPEVVTGC